MTYSQCLKITQNVAFEFFNQFYSIKIDLSGNTFWPQASVFPKLTKIDNFGIFNEFLSTQIVKVARFARNVKWDFFVIFKQCAISDRVYIMNEVTWESFQTIWFNKYFFRYFMFHFNELFYLQFCNCQRLKRQILRYISHLLNRLQLAVIDGRQSQSVHFKTTAKKNVYCIKLGAKKSLGSLGFSVKV